METNRVDDVIYLDTSQNDDVLLFPRSQSIDLESNSISVESQPGVRRNVTSANILLEEGMEWDSSLVSVGDDGNDDDSQSDIEVQEITLMSSSSSSVSTHSRSKRKRKNRGKNKSMGKSIENKKNVSLEQYGEDSETIKFNMDKEIQNLTKQIMGLEERKQLLQAMRSSLGDDAYNGPPTDRMTSDHKDWQGKYDWTDAANLFLRQQFKLASFRPLQEEVINATMSKKDVMLILPTGGGKSLSYQLSGVLSEGITLVISPLLSLTKDQIGAMQRINVNATTISSAIRPNVANDIMQRLTDPNTSIKFLFVTPEKVAKSGRLMGNLRQVYEAGRLCRIVIDEVHCCSQWGHDFRPDYLKLGILRRNFPNVPILGCTATASRDVQKDVINVLGIRDCVLIRGHFNRPNLIYEVRNKAEKSADCTSDIAKFIRTKYPTSSGIIYCLSKKNTEDLADELHSYRIPAAAYNSSLDSETKERVQDAWFRGDVQVIVATVAFGMGINKENVRYVIHHTMSKSLVGYCQESGRAGRDGQPAHCILYYSPADVDKSLVMATGQKGRNHLMDMITYCHDKWTCRRKLMGLSLGEDFDSSKCREYCDNCRDKRPMTVLGIREDALEIHEVIKSTDKLLTLKQVVTKWKSPATISANNFRRKKMTMEYREQVMITLLLQGYLTEFLKPNKNSTNVYIRRGKNVTEREIEMKVVPTNEAKNGVDDSSDAASSSQSKKRKIGEVNKKAENVKKASAPPKKAGSKRVAERSSSAGRKEFPGKGRPLSARGEDDLEIVETNRLVDGNEVLQMEYRRLAVTHSDNPAVSQSSGTTVVLDDDDDFIANSPNLSPIPPPKISGDEDSADELEPTPKRRRLRKLKDK